MSRLLAVRSIEVAIVAAAVFLAVVPVAVAFANPSVGGRFTDDEGSIFEASISRMAAGRVTGGCAVDGDKVRFCPDDRVTREQMAAFLVRTFGYVKNGNGDVFSDDDDSMFENDIEKLAAASVALGCNPPSNTRSCSSEPVRRDQMASFLARALDLSPIGGSGVWRLAPAMTWQWRLAGEVDTSVNTEVFSIDLFEAPASVVTTLQSKGSRVICYLSAGSYEYFRPDSDEFFQRCSGGQMGGPGNNGWTFDVSMSWLQSWRPGLTCFVAGASTGWWWTLLIGMALVQGSLSPGTTNSSTTVSLVMHPTRGVCRLGGRTMWIRPRSWRRSLTMRSMRSALCSMNALRSMCSLSRVRLCPMLSTDSMLTSSAPRSRTLTSHQ
jgi:hypothetical protein